MKKIWAPWRMVYILQKKQRGCFFCRDLRRKKDEETLILYRGDFSFVMMNRFPYNNGHLMVIPKRHCLDLDNLDKNESQEIFALLQASIRILRSNLGPQGFNVGVNLGKIAGAGEDHVHFHIGPRWPGDTNYMPVLGETKIIPQYLGETYRKLHSAFQQVLPKKRVRKGGGKR